MLVAQNAVAQAVLAAQQGLGWRGDIHPDTLDAYLFGGWGVVFMLMFGVMTLFREQFEHLSGWEINFAPLQIVRSLSVAQCWYVAAFVAAKHVFPQLRRLDTPATCTPAQLRLRRRLCMLGTAGIPLVASAPWWLRLLFKPLPAAQEQHALFVVVLLVSTLAYFWEWLWDEEARLALHAGQHQQQLQHQHPHHD